MSLPVLKKATVNQNLTFTLTEKTTISNPTYLFCFQSDQTFTDYCVIATVQSNTQRANIFTIEEGVNDPLNGQIILGNVGFYSYTVYAQSSTTNLDPSLADEEVESGKMKLIDDENSQYIEHEPNATYIIHEPTQ